MAPSIRICGECGSMATDSAGNLQHESWCPVDVGMPTCSDSHDRSQIALRDDLRRELKQIVKEALREHEASKGFDFREIEAAKED